MFVDVHAHLYGDRYSDIEKVILRSKEAGVEKIICSGSDLDNSKLSVKLANTYPFIYASVGIHPDDVENYNDKMEEELKNLAMDKKVVAIGEIGLDYYTSTVSKDKQKEAFVKMIKLAYSLKKPIIIHSRDATGDMIEILSQNKDYLKYGGVVHCFNKNHVVANTFLSLGLYLSLGGALTFNESKKLRQSVIEAPIEKLLLETDCPYMTPQALKGQVNEPKNVKYVAEEIAQLKNLSVEEVAKITTENAKKLFKF